MLRSCYVSFKGSACVVYERSVLYCVLQGLSASAFDYLTGSFHHGEVTGMDVCIRKPIIATCSLDKTIRVWNYENKSVLLSHFPHTQQLQSSPPLSLSLSFSFSTHTHTHTHTH